MVSYSVFSISAEAELRGRKKEKSERVAPSEARET